jgi:hypothetical protein
MTFHMPSWFFLPLLFSQWACNPNTCLDLAVFDWVFLGWVFPWKDLFLYIHAASHRHLAIHFGCQKRGLPIQKLRNYKFAGDCTLVDPLPCVFCFLCLGPTVNLKMLLNCAPPTLLVQNSWPCLNFHCSHDFSFARSKPISISGILQKFQNHTSWLWPESFGVLVFIIHWNFQ